jgi:hypothetical protein
MSLRTGSAFTRRLPRGRRPGPSQTALRACTKPATIEQWGEMFPGSRSNARLFVASCGAAEEAERKRREEPGQRKRLTPDDQTGDTKATKRTVAFSCTQPDPIRPCLLPIPQSKGYMSPQSSPPSGTPSCIIVRKGVTDELQELQGQDNLQG